MTILAGSSLGEDVRPNEPTIAAELELILRRAEPDALPRVAHGRPDPPPEARADRGDDVRHASIPDLRRAIEPLAS